MPGAFITRDLNSLLASSDFGEASSSIIYKGRSIQGIFDDEDVEIALGEGVVQIGHQICLTAKSADFDGIADGDHIAIRGNNFVIKHWKDDGTGLIEVFMAVT